jgi:hypothetical protein
VLRTDRRKKIQTRNVSDLANMNESKVWDLNNPKNGVAINQHGKGGETADFGMEDMEFLMFLYVC